MSGTDEPLIEIPEGFKGLEKARRAKSTTPPEEQKRCRECGSRDIGRKVDSPFQRERRRDGLYRCHCCGEHFDEPLPPEAEEQDTKQTKLITDGGWPEGDPCPDCGELMDVGAVGNPGETITWQDCEDCGIGWGPFTGFVPLDEDETAASSTTDTDRGDGIETDGGVGLDRCRACFKPLRTESGELCAQCLDSAAEPIVPEPVVTNADPTSLASRIENAHQQLARGIDADDADDEWVRQALDEIMGDLKTLARVVEGDSPDATQLGGRV